MSDIDACVTCNKPLNFCQCTAWAEQEVEFVRHGRYMDFGVGFHHNAWFVFDSAGFQTEQPMNIPKWHMHCGPFGTAQQARDWINEVIDGGGNYD